MRELESAGFASTEGDLVEFDPDILECASTAGRQFQRDHDAGASIECLDDAIIGDEVVFPCEDIGSHLEAFCKPSALLLVAVEDRIDLVLIVEEEVFGGAHVGLGLHGDHLAGAVALDGEEPIKFSAEDGLRVLAGGLHGSAHEAIDAVMVDLHVAARDLPSIHLLDSHNLSPAGIERTVFRQESLEVFDGVFHGMRQVFLGDLHGLLNGLHLLAALLQIVERDAPDGDLEEPIHILVGHIAHQLLPEGLQAGLDRLLDLRNADALLDALVDAVLDEDPLQRELLDGLQLILQIQLQLRLQDGAQTLHIPAEDLADRQATGLIVLDDGELGVEGLLALGICIERLDGLLGIDSALQRDLDMNLGGAEVIDGGDLQLSGADCAFDGGDEGLRVGISGEFLDDDLLVTLGLDARAHHNGPQAVLVSGGIHDAAQREIGEHLEGLVPQDCNLRLEELLEVMGEDAGGDDHAHAILPQHEKRGHLRREHHGLPVAAIVGIHVFRDRGIEEDLASKGIEPALDITAGGRRIARDRIAEITLLVNEIALVGQHHQRTANGGVTVGMILHGLAHHTIHLVEATVVNGLEGMEDAPLDGLEAVIHIGDGAVLVHIRRIEDVVGFQQIPQGIGRGIPGIPRNRPGIPGIRHRLGGLGHRRLRLNGIGVLCNCSRSGRVLQGRINDGLVTLGGVLLLFVLLLDHWMQ